MTKARKNDTPQADNVKPLTGSTPPGAGNPTFEPATNRVIDEPGYLCLSRPAMRSSSQRLAELVAEHRRIVDFYDTISMHEDRSRGRFGDGTAHATNMLDECEALIEAIPARSLHDLGLKARVLSWSRAQWWDERETHEPGARNLVDDVLSLAGLDRVRRPGWSFTEIMPDYQGQPRHLPEQKVGPEPAPTSIAPSTDTEVGQLAAEYRDATLRLDRLDEGHTETNDARLERLKVAEAERISNIAERATFVRAGTAQDALFQIMLAHSEVGDMAAEILFATNDTAVRQSVDEQMRRITRCLWSIRELLEKLAGVEGSTLNRGWAMEPTSNPFILALDDLLARARTDHAKQVAA